MPYFPVLSYAMLKTKFFIALVLASVVFLLSHCTQDATPDFENMTGEELAHQYCGSCHLFPEPELLPKERWENGVLPQMSWRLGIRNDKVDPFEGAPYDERIAVIKAQVFPTQPVIPDTAWRKIVTYYLDNAPASPSLPDNRKPVALNLQQFEVEPLSVNQNQKPGVTLLQWDSSRQEIILADAYNQLFRLQSDGKVASVYGTDSPVTSLYQLPSGEEFWTKVGYINPNSRQQGVVYHKKGNRFSMVADSLYRPVHTNVADLNGDGKEDFIVCEFGHQLGRLSWHEQTAAGYQQHVISSVPGAIRTHITDWEEDGDWDILVLMGQGNEGIFLHENDGAGHFQSRQILQFQSVFGSSDFELVDLNGDGIEEILYANGDNADYSYSPKAYHGLRIFQQNEAGAFEEAWFFPMYGATKVRAHDFDQDGDMDLAAMGFFPEYELAPEEGFVYLENVSTTSSAYQFRPMTFPNAELGHWLVMNCGDVDSDGDMDILLGSYTLISSAAPKALQQAWAENRIEGVLLRNTLY